MEGFFVSMGEYIEPNNTDVLLNDPTVVGNILFFYVHHGSLEEWNHIPWNERLKKMAAVRECEWIERDDVFGRQKKEDYDNSVIRNIRKFFKGKKDYPINEVGPLVVCKLNEKLYITLDGHHRGRMAGTGDQIGQVCAQVIHPGELNFLGLTAEQLIVEAEETLNDFFPDQFNRPTIKRNEP